MPFGPFNCRTGSYFYQITDVASARALIGSLDDIYRGRVHWQLAEQRLDWADQCREMMIHADEAFYNALRLEGWLAR